MTDPVRVPCSIPLAPSPWRATSTRRALVPFSALGRPLQIEVDLGGTSDDVRVSATIDGVPCEAPPERDSSTARVPCDLGEPIVGRRTLRVSVVGATTREEIVDVLVVPGPVGALWSDRAVPEDLVALVVRLARGARSAEDALARFVAGIQADGLAWVYRSDGASCISNHRDPVEVHLLDVLLGLGSSGRFAASTVAVDCQALAGLVACAGALLGCDAWAARLFDDEAFLADAALGTNRVLPLGDPTWRYPEPTGTLRFHEVAIVGDLDDRATWRVFDPSFRLDISDPPHLRPHDAGVVAGWRLADYLARLVPEVGAGLWDLRKHPTWPRAVQVPFDVADGEPRWVRREDEPIAELVDRIEREAPVWATKLIRKVVAEGLEPFAVCVPDEFRMIAFLSGAREPVQMRATYNLPGQAGFLPLPSEGVEIDLRAIGDTPREMPGLARRLGARP